MSNAPYLSLNQKRTLAMTAQLRQAIGLLQHNNSDLRSYLEKMAAGNAFLEIRMAEPGRERRHAEARGGIGANGPLHEGSNDPFPARTSSLNEHVARQIGLSFSTAEDKRIAFAFLEALEPFGWLGADLADIADKCGCSVVEAESVLETMQQFEPAGLFARSLSECLRLQALDDGKLDASLARLLDNLHLLAEGGPDALAQVCGCSLSEVRDGLSLLRTYDPKPGSAFLETDFHIRPPDLLLREQLGGWTVELNGSTLPEVVIRDEPAAHGADEADALAFAKGLKRAVDQRNANTLAVAREVVRRQSGFLRERDAYPQPLTLLEVAEAIGVHASTVSRVVNGLTMEAPCGIVELRRCFGRGLPAQSGEASISTESVKHRIRQMIEGEPQARPLSDGTMCTTLKAEGIRVERRTVAKYRMAMDIPSSSARRRREARRPRR
jgi:RNA polymerase sigma-54 factor